ncbi:MAG: hypothetical protein IPM98_18455 [Lewinellaceae bacterium]|nr:hypothetical protein [Lewinellaceae bacterium]
MVFSPSAVAPGIAKPPAVLLGENTKQGAVLSTLSAALGVFSPSAVAPGIAKPPAVLLGENTKQGAVPSTLSAALGVFTKRCRAGHCETARGTAW